MCPAFASERGLVSTTQRRVVITGLGLVSPLGSSASTLWEGLVAGRSAVAPITQFCADSLPTQVAAEATPPCCDPHQPTPAAMASTALSHQIATADGQGCIAGSILRGLATPKQCPSFGTTCTPEQPLGAPMVSSEGACVAYFLYRRHSETPLAGAGPEAHPASAARC